MSPSAAKGVFLRLHAQHFVLGVATQLVNLFPYDAYHTYFLAATIV